MDFLKKNWKNILLILISFLFVVTCTSKGNYKRKYNKQVERNEYILDSVEYMNRNSSKYIDSLKNIIQFDKKEIEYLNNQLDIYKDQNNKLANKKIQVIIPSDESTERK